nr:BTAD domain-containing putative transcriptional regulator [Kineosporia rhizophila]
MICRVLGPLEVVLGSTRVEVGGPQPRRLVQALVTARGGALTEEQLAEAIWGDSPPANPAASLQAYVSRLRKLLGAQALTRGPGGYALIAQSDVLNFEALVAQARAAQRPADALRDFRGALKLWRGRPYPDLEAFGDQERHQLIEQHAAALEDQAAALLAVGDAPAAVAELRTAVRDEPYRERGWELLILGLYRSARQAEAFSALRQVRALLADDLGVDPGPELQNLERRLLAQDPSLLLDAGARLPALQRPLTHFVGRENEKRLLSEAMAETRLMTLVGPGGAGKTRLALEWAGTVPLARLADVHSPLDLPSVIAQALGMAETPGRFTGLRGLLILDNCEHLTSAVADLAVTLLADNPELRILATSREALGVDGERLLPVDPLPQTDAVVLLSDRIAAVRPGWRPDESDSRELARLAEALDGIPLALELAAARARVLSLADLTGLLGSRFPALGPVPRNALNPHSTLEATVAWSVNLLPPGERQILLRLWPFEGGFTLEAAEALGCDLDALSSMVSRSVVSADTTLTPARYRMLEIIRAYCRDRDPDQAGSRAAHAAWSRDLVARTVPDLRGKRSARSIRVLNRELPNIRAGLVHDLAAAPIHALRTAGLLEWFWLRAGHVAEGVRLLEQALDGAPEAAPVDRARAFSAWGTLYWIGGDIDTGWELVQRAMAELGRPTDDDERRLLAQLQYYEGMFWTYRGEFQRAADSARASIELAEQIGRAWFGTVPQIVLGSALVGLGSLAEGQRVLRAAIAEAQQNAYGWAGGLGNLTLARSMLNDDPRGALAPLHRAIELFREEDDAAEVLACLVYGARALLHLGHPLEAATLHTAAYQRAQQRGIRLDNSDPITTAAIRAEIEALEPELLASARRRAGELAEDELVGMLPGQDSRALTSER